MITEKRLELDEISKAYTSVGSLIMKTVSRQEGNKTITEPQNPIDAILQKPMSDETRKKYFDMIMPDAQKIIEKFKNNEFADKSGPLSLDLRTGNKCNLKCRMCTPYKSSLMFAEQKRMRADSSSYNKMSEKYFGPVDGMSGQRVLEAISQIMEKSA